MSRFLYLRFLIGGLNVAFVVAVASMTLALALTISFRALRDNADTAVSRLGVVTARNVDGFFAAPQKHLEDIGSVNSRFSGMSTLPSESPTFGANGTAATPGGEILQTYRQVAAALMVDAKFRYRSVTIVFADGSYVWLVPSYIPPLRTTLLGAATSWPTGPLPTQVHPLVTSGHVLPSGDETPQATAIVSQLIASLGVVTDIRIPQFRARFDFLYASGTRSQTNVSWGDFYLTSAIGQEYFFLYLVRPIYNKTGSHLGYVDTVLSTDDVSGLLTEGQLTPATRLVLYDIDGFLFGASSGVSAYRSENFTGPTAEPGCTTTNQSRFIFPSAPNLRACRFHIRDTPIAIVRDAVRKDEAFFMGSRLGGAVKLISKEYVFVQKLPTLQGKRAFTIAMVVPEEDMIGDAKKILPLCAGVTAGVVVLVAALSLVLVWLVLRPLQGIAERMGKAARLEQDTEEVTISNLVEIGDLQRAFVDLRDELNRIRAFVPQALLRANDTDEDADAYDADLVTSTHEESSVCQESLHRGMVSPLKTMSKGSMSRGSPSMSPASPASFRGNATGCSFASKPSADNASSRYGRMAYSPHTRSAVKFGSGAKPKLHLNAGVRHENVSVLSLNLRGYHAAVKAGLSVERVAATVEAVFRIAQQEKGVVDSFHGDRFLISFNAVKPAANHAIRASIVAARVIAALGAEDNAGYALPVTAGVASGMAQVGNLGSSEMKRFSIVGPVVSQAACLERLCKLYPGVSCLVPQRLFVDLRTAVLVETVDYARVPFAVSPMLLGAVRREHTHAVDDEWMYQLQQACRSSVCDTAAHVDLSVGSVGYVHHANEIWQCLTGPRPKAAAVLLEKLEDQSGVPPSAALKNTVAQIMQTATSPPGPSPASLPLLPATPPPSDIHPNPSSAPSHSAPPARAGASQDPCEEILMCRLAPRDFGAFYNDAVLDGDSVQRF